MYVHTQHRNEIIQKKLKGIEEIETTDADALLGIETDTESDYDE